MSELTAYEEFTSMISACAGCGDTEPPEMSEAEAVEALEAYRQLEKTESGRRINASLRRIDLLCPRCMNERDMANAQQKRQMHVDAVWRNTYGRKLMVPKSKKQTFEHSDSAIEARNPEPWEWARRWTPNSGNAWIYGLEGVGKTFFARAIAMDQLKNGFRVAEVSAIEWVERAGDYKWQERRARLADVYLLIFEDVDKAGWTPRGFEALYELINLRYESECRTLITSNGTPQYMDRPWRRVQNSPSGLGTMWKRLLPCKRLELTGESLRSGEYAQDIHETPPSVPVAEKMEHEAARIEGEEEDQAIRAAVAGKRKSSGGPVAIGTLAGESLRKGTE